QIVDVEGIVDLQQLQGVGKRGIDVEVGLQPALVTMGATALITDALSDVGAGQLTAQPPAFTGRVFVVDRVDQGAAVQKRSVHPAAQIPQAGALQRQRQTGGGKQPADIAAVIV